MNKFETGDRVKFRSWEDMRKEFGLTKNGDIDVNEYAVFSIEMKHLCGTYATIAGFSNDKSVRLKDFSSNGSTNWLYFTEMFEMEEQE